MKLERTHINFLLYGEDATAFLKLVEAERKRTGYDVTAGAVAKLAIVDYIKRNKTK